MSKKIKLTRQIDRSLASGVRTASTAGALPISPPSGGGALPIDTYVQRSADLLTNAAVFATGANTISSEAQLALSRGGTAANLSATVGLLKQATSGAAVTVGILTDTEHGSRGGGSLHAAATTSVAGFLSAADKTKLDGIGAGASVSSVALAAPSFLSVAGSPVTTAGTLTLSLANQNANLVFAGPSTGSPAAPTFRSIVKADLPSVTAYTDAANTFTTDQTITGRLNLQGFTSEGGSSRLTRTDSAGTNNEASVFVLTRSIAGTPVGGFGAMLEFLLKSSTTDNQLAGRIVALWDVATDATRRSRLRFSASDSAGVNRTFLNGGSDGTQPTIGVLGAAAIPRQTLPAAATDATTTQALVNALRTMVINFGFAN